MNIKTKYRIGDKVKVYADKMLFSECPFCNGMGYRIIQTEGSDDGKRYCQNCDGEGQYKTRLDDNELVEGVITGMHIDVMTEEEDEFDDASFVEDGLAVAIDYYVNTPETHWGYGTYKEKQIFGIVTEK